VNNDGHLDLVAVSPGHTFVDLMLGNGDGSFQPMQRIVAGPLPTTSVALADLNQDGALDIVTATTTTSNQSSVSLLLGRGDGSFQAPVLFPAVDRSVEAPKTVIVGDFNGDGIPDVAALITQVQPGSRNVVSVLLGNGDGSLRPPEQTDIDQRVSIADGAQVAADLNGDGLTDVVTANFGSDTVSVLLQESQLAPSSVSLLVGNGDGSFQDVQHFGTSLNSGALAVGGAPAPAIDAATVDSLLASHPGEAAGFLLAAGRRTAPGEAFADWLNPL